MSSSVSISSSVSKPSLGAVAVSEQTRWRGCQLRRFAHAPMSPSCLPLHRALVSRPVKNSRAKEASTNFLGSSPGPPVSIRRRPPHNVPRSRHLTPPTATPPQWRPRLSAPATIHAQGAERSRSSWRLVGGIRSPRRLVGGIRWSWDRAEHLAPSLRRAERAPQPDGRAMRPQGLTERARSPQRLVGGIRSPQRLLGGIRSPRRLVRGIR